MWYKPVINLGTVPENSTQIITFVMTGNKEIKKNAHPQGGYAIVTSCGCSSADWNPNTKKLIVTYNTGTVPVHLATQGQTSLTASKNITITYTDNSKEVLTFTATVSKRV